MDLRITCKNAAGFEKTVATLGVRYDSTCLSHQQQTSSHVPRRNSPLPNPVKAPGCHPSEIERG